MISEKQATVADLGRRRYPTDQRDTTQLQLGSVASRTATAPSTAGEHSDKTAVPGGLRSGDSQSLIPRVDGQRLADARRQTPEVVACSEFNVEFEQRFASPGPHVVSVVLDADHLPTDDRADAVVDVFPPFPVLMVDGDPQLDPTRSETFFARWPCLPPRTRLP